MDTEEKKSEINANNSLRNGHFGDCDCCFAYTDS